MQEYRDDINLLSRFLAQRDVSALTPFALQQALGAPKAELMILLGGIIPHGCAAAAQALKAGVADKVLVAGGAGHTTPYFRAQVAARCPHIATENRSEADIMADILVLEYGIDRSDLLLENTSTNCGENAAFALKVAQQNALQPKTVLLLHDSTMQRRIGATFEKVWGTQRTFVNYATYVPQVETKSGALAFTGSPLWGMWSMQHFLSLVLGEIVRLHDTPSGYGPAGKDYIAHVEVPPDVLAAYSRVADKLGTAPRL